MSIVTVTPGTDTLSVAWPDGQISHFHYIWLRDNCNCDICRHPQVGERLLDPFTIPLDIVPDRVYLDQANAVNITWAGDGHRTIYDADWLYHNAYEPEMRAARRPQPALWESSIASSMPEIEHDRVMGSDEGLLAWLRLLRQYGFAIVRNTPATPGQVAKVAERISYLRLSNFGAIFNVESMPNPNSIAYTAHQLNAHTDLVSREVQPGLQFLHCLVFEAEGGESILVDGFAVAKALRQDQPADYETLTTTPIRFRYQDRETDVAWKSPMIRLDADGCLFEIRYSTALLAPLDIDPYMVKPFYQAYHNFTALLRDPKFELRFKLKAGDLMVFDNRRVLHGRAAFNPQSGPRHLQGCYIDTDDFLSRLRVLERQVAPDRWKPNVRVARANSAG